MKKIILAALAIVLFAVPVLAADVPLKWEAVEGATGYNLYMSTDQGATWLAPVDVGLVTEYTYTGVPDTGLILFKAAAYNAYGEAVQTAWGVWYCGDWKPPLAAKGLTIP